MNFPLGALAHLELGRAYAVAGDKTKARAAYLDFFSLWKDADPDIPILIAAKTEYAKLKRSFLGRFFLPVEGEGFVRLS